MSLGIIIKGPEGLVLAAESRVTISSNLPGGGAIHVNYDNATKVLSFGEPHNYVGVVTYDNKLVAALRAADFLLTPEQTQKLNDCLRTLQMQIPLQSMALQDCVDLASFFIRTTISAQQLTIGIRGCGGATDVATITRRQGLSFVQRKSIKIS